MIQNKHIIRLSFIGLFLNIVANIVFYRYSMIEETVLKQAIKSNINLVANYQNYIWKVKPKQNKHTSKNSEFSKNEIKFIKETDRFFSNRVHMVTIYNSECERIYTNRLNKETSISKNKNNYLYEWILLTLDQYFLKKYISKSALSDAYSGKIGNDFAPRALIYDKNRMLHEKSYIKSYIPIIDSTSGNYRVEGVVEIFTDITEQLDSTTFLEKKILVAFIIIFIVFFIVVMYNTNYAQGIINKQFETNRDLENAKIQAEMESSAKTDFLSNISHELRTPLNAIIGFSEIIIAKTYGSIENKKYNSYILDINSSGKHLLSVINDILDFSKVSADKLKIENVELDLNKLASSSMRYVKPRADELGIKLIEAMPTEHMIIIADSKRLKQALLNLLSNAVKFTPQGGSITLGLKKDEAKKEVTISIVDTGMGMNDSDIPKALSSFGQIDNTIRRKYEGTGLGLPLTKKLVELMGGVFDIQSKVNKGTKVTICFGYTESIEL